MVALNTTAVSKPILLVRDVLALRGIQSVVESLDEFRARVTGQTTTVRVPFRATRTPTRTSSGFAGLFSVVVEIRVHG